jgi:hypothetical protein
LTRTAPFRFFVLWMTALMVVAAMASSSARGLGLGEPAVLSAFGQPLRAVIPLSTAPGERVAAGCMNLMRTAGDGLGDVVTAKVSLERAAAGMRLLVTTGQAVYEPVLRISIEAGCETPVRRSYTVLLDPNAADSSAAATTATAAAAAPLARAPGQERPAAIVPAAARRDPSDSSGIGAARLAQRPVGTERAGRLTPAVLQYDGDRPSIAASTGNRGSLQQIAMSESVRVPVQHVEPTPIQRANDNWWTLVVAISGLCAIVLGAVLVRHGRHAPRSVAWSNASARSRTHTSGPRSVTQSSSAAIVTLAHSSAPASGLLTRAAPTTRSWVAAATPVTLPNLTTSSERTISRQAPATLSKPRSAAPREEVLDSLLNEIESDLNVETAVREAHAAARTSLGQDIGSDAILQAIESAERDFMLTTPAPAEAALGHALDDELLGKRRRGDKAA